MFDLGLFVADSYNQSQRQLDDKLSVLSKLGIEGGLVHFNHEGGASDFNANGFYPALNATQIGQPEVDVQHIKYITHRQSISEAPTKLSALIAKCADLKAILFVASPYSEGQSSSPVLAPRAGYRQVNYALAKALTLFLVDEATYYGCNLHIHGLASADEIAQLQPARAAGRVSISLPVYMLARGQNSFGYHFSGRLSPAQVSTEEQETLFNSVLSNQVDSLTTHHHLFAEQLELDPLSADKGADFSGFLSSWLSGLRTELGDELFTRLTQTQPKNILAV